VLVVFLVGAQFIRPAHTNPTSDLALGYQAHVQVTPEVGALLQRACADCHSNNTRWPWYSNVAPVSWFVIGHVNEARDHLNLSQWDPASLAGNLELLGEIHKVMKFEEMPLRSYTWMHPQARLSTRERGLIGEWALDEQRRLSAERVRELARENDPKATAAEQ
jgi:hypothetical protein